MKKLLLISMILSLTGCFSPPPPTPYPKKAKIIGLNNPNETDTFKTDKIIKNSFDKRTWDVNIPVFLNKNNELTAYYYSELELNYYLGNSDIIKIRGNPILANKIYSMLLSEKINAQIIIDKNCVVTDKPIENCKGVNLNFTKGEKSEV